jgi:hypothetical protein
MEPLKPTIHLWYSERYVCMYVCMYARGGIVIDSYFELLMQENSTY